MNEEEFNALFDLTEEADVVHLLTLLLSYFLALHRVEEIMAADSKSFCQKTGEIYESEA